MLVKDDRIYYQIQKIIMPNLDLGGDASLYVRPHGPNAGAIQPSRRILLNKFGVWSFDTFYNGLTVQSWKKHTEVSDLFFTLEGQGRFIVRIGLHRLECDQRFLIETECEIFEGKPYRLPIQNWGTLVNGLLYAEIQALEESSISGGKFETTSPPLKNVHLGLVITHFKRENAVKKAALRIQSTLSQEQEGKNIRLVVVDNSQTLIPEDVSGATLLPNKNLGGSGGFTRGLLYLKDEGSFTHCLFMDDDASCEVESILRSYRLLSYSKTPRFAIAGSLLREMAPHFLFEKGATFDGMCRPQHHGLDMRNVHHLLLAEFETRLPDYGGWWFFAFCLNDIRHFPFPFFVRGDDIMFGMINNFVITTQNGIASYGDDFGYKSGPLQIYLDVRNHLVQVLTHMNGSYADCEKLLNQFFDSSVRSFNYATARAVSMAIEDVSKGLSFWIQNMDMSEIKKKFTSLNQSEKMQPLSLTDIPGGVDIISHAHWTEKLYRRFVRKLTFNGLLLPNKLKKKTPILQNKNFSGDARVIFRYNSVVYYYNPTEQGYIAHRDLSRLISETKVFWKARNAFKTNFTQIKLGYERGYLDLTTEDFWRGVYRNIK